MVRERKCKEGKWRLDQRHKFREKGERVCLRDTMFVEKLIEIKIGVCKQYENVIKKRLEAAREALILEIGPSKY